jgi:hypothetical protein
VSNLKLIDHPLKADEIRIVMDRAVAVAHAGGHTWVTEVDMLTHRGACAPGSEERPVEGYSLAFKVPRHGLELDKALALAQWVSSLLNGRGAASCRLEHNELWFGRFSPAQLRVL